MYAIIVHNHMTETVKKLAPEILDVIKKSESILLHCHPSPDPDSVGSALAMKFALQSLGKKVTIIAGDSPVPSAFSHFPGFAEIIPKISLKSTSRRLIFLLFRIAVHLIEFLKKAQLFFQTS